MASLIDLQNSKIAIGSTSYPSDHNTMVDDIETGVNSGISTSNDAYDLALAVSNDSFNATSLTTLTPSTVSKTFDLEDLTPRAYTIGTEIKATSAATPTVWMKGYVTSYNSGTQVLIVLVTSIGAATSKSDWNIGPYASSGLSSIVDDTNPELGGDLDCGGNQILEDSYIQATDGNGSGTITLNYASGGTYKFTSIGDITGFTTTNFITGAVCTMVIDAVNWGTYNIAHPAAWKFSGGLAPTYTETGTDRLLLFKDANELFMLTVVAFDIKVAP